MKVNIAILTVTDTRTFENDKSGSILVKKIEEASHNLFDRKICKDEKEDIKKEIQSATFERLLKHLDERKDVQNIDLMNLANFCRNCLSRWYREEAEKKGISISDPDARKHVYGMPYPEWKEKYQK